MEAGEEPADDGLDATLTRTNTAKRTRIATHDQDTDAPQPTRPVVMKVAVAEPTEPDYLDVDVVEDSGALPAGVSAAETEPVLPVRGRRADETEFDAAAAREPRPSDDDDYEYIEDSSGLEPEDEDDAIEDGTAAPVAPAASRRRRFDTKTAAAVSARKYAFRKRVLMVMAVVLVGSATAAFEVSPTAWWVCGSATGVTVLYLAYLRRQTRIEEKVRRRRMQRMARARLGVENAARPRIRRGPVAAAAPGRGGPGDRRRGPDLRASGLRDADADLRLAQGPAASRRPVALGSSAVGVAAGSLLAIRGYGAVGSATRSHRVGQGFESP